MAELDDRGPLEDGGQADRDGADRSGQTSELTQDQEPQWTYRSHTGLKGRIRMPRLDPDPDNGG